MRIRTPLISTHLTSAEGEYKSPYGEIKSKWQKTDSGLILEVIIPANTTARIQIPLIEHTSLAKKSLLNQKENTAALFGQKVLVNGEILNDEDLVGQDKKSKTITVDAGSYIIEVK